MAEGERRGLVASVVMSANPIVDNLRLIVPVTRQAHTPPSWDTREKRQGGEGGRERERERKRSVPSRRYFIFPSPPRAKAAFEGDT